MSIMPAGIIFSRAPWAAVMAGRIPAVRADIDASAVGHGFAVVLQYSRLLMVGASSWIPAVDHPFASNCVEKIACIFVFSNHPAHGKRGESHRRAESRRDCL